MVIYDLSTSLPSVSHIDCFPFEPFREPLVIIAIADGLETEGATDAGQIQPINGTSPQVDEQHLPTTPEGLQRELQAVADDHPRSILQRLMIFDHQGVNELVVGSDQTFWIPAPQSCRSTTIKTAMCDMTASLLWEMNRLAEVVRDMPSIESPRPATSATRLHRQERPLVPLDGAQQRMTMPAQLPSRPLSTPGSSDGLGGHLPGTESPVTFDEITRSISTERPDSSYKSQSSTRLTSPVRRDRLSLGGAVPVTEKTRQRVKGRRHVALGALYLLSGRWPDALKELSDGVIATRATGDYTWNAKAMELMLVCLLLYGWAGIDFQIPPAFYPVAEKPSIKQAFTTSLSSDAPSNGATKRSAALRSLANATPGITAYIQKQYTRATSATDEALPQLLYSEVIIRLSRLLCALHLRGGLLNDQTLRHIVLHERIHHDKSDEFETSGFHMTRAEIAAFACAGLPAASGSTPATDAVIIFSGIAQVMSVLGFDRKKAFILRQLIAIMVPGLVQARKIGAAEVGIHPAAGLQVLNTAPVHASALDEQPDCLESSIRAFAKSITDVYAVLSSAIPAGEPASSTANQTRATEAQSRDSNDAILTRLTRLAYHDSIGDLRLKIDILRSCISLCEALPDFQGVLQFTSELLRVIMMSLTLEIDGPTPLPALPREEQLRLLGNIQRTVGAAHQVAGLHLEAEYWDDCLVRDVSIARLPASRQLYRRTRKDLGLSQSDRRSPGTSKNAEQPLICNPFAKLSNVSTEESVLVAGEPAVVVVTLQNVFEFELEVVSIDLEGHGVTFSSQVTNTVIGPCSMQQVPVTITAIGAGTLTITGCIVQIRDCRRRRFPIMRAAWSSDAARIQKMKTKGLAALDSSGATDASNTNASFNRPVPAEVEVAIIESQPTIAVRETSFAQSAIGLLEGETKDVTITVENTSDRPVDFLFVTFEDTSTQRLQAALQDRDIPATETYELEAQLLEHPSLEWRREAELGFMSIPPHSQNEVTIAVYGKPGLSEAIIKIDYGCASVGDARNMPETFFSRQLTLPITVTVNASVEIVNCDILPFTSSIPWTLHTCSSDDQSKNGSQALRASDYLNILALGDDLDQHIPATPSGNDKCLMVLDLCNAWPAPITVTLEVLQHGDDSDALLVSLARHDTQQPVMLRLTEPLPPGQIVRMVLPVSRIYIADPLQPIPSLNKHEQRQFVVSALKTSVEVEAATREMFWFPILIAVAKGS
ncbi:hypothetical protein KEM52_001012 [Ascosphaera acerosa]|nr:hypothetical protein KEM52_001012 [Ascosphaera acerosa]